MNSLREIKYVGGIGAIFVCHGWVPFLGILLYILGVLLLIVAFYKLGHEVNNKGIFNKFLIGKIIGMLVVLIIFLIIFGIFYPFFSGFLYFILHRLGIPIGFMSGKIVLVLICWVLGIMGAFFCAKSYKLVSKSVKIDIFDTAGVFLLWGAITSIFLVGFLLLFISNILLAIGFFLLPATINLKQR